MEEKDLYQPVKDLFESMGYDVYGEVKSVDVVARNGDGMIAIELKKELNLHLMAQGAQRQRLTDHVYLAIPAPTTKVQRGSAFKDKLFLLRRLGIGLIYIGLKRKPHRARIIMEPHLIDIKASQQRSKKKRLALEREMAGRHRDYNTGGTKGRIMTAYREAALRILHHMKDGDAHKGSDIKHMTGIENATRILYSNHYDWFHREGKGFYRMTEAGQKALVEYATFIDSIL